MQIIFAENIFGEKVPPWDIFAKFIFAILPQNCEIKFHNFWLIRITRENKFHELFLQNFFPNKKQSQTSYVNSK